MWTMAGDDGRGRKQGDVVAMFVEVEFG